MQSLYLCFLSIAHSHTPTTPKCYTRPKPGLPTSFSSLSTIIISLSVLCLALFRHKQIIFLPCKEHECPFLSLSLSLSPFSLLHVSLLSCPFNTSTHVYWLLTMCCTKPNSRLPVRYLPLQPLFATRQFLGHLAMTS